MSHLKLTAYQAILRATELNSLHAELLEEATTLTLQTQVQQVVFVQVIQTSLEDLTAQVTSSLAIYQATEADKWKFKDQELLEQLGSKGATFFRLGFEGAVKQIRS